MVIWWTGNWVSHAGSCIVAVLVGVAIVNVAAVVMDEDTLTCSVIAVPADISTGAMTYQFRVVASTQRDRGNGGFMKWRGPCVSSFRFAPSVGRENQVLDASVRTLVRQR